MRTQQSVAKGSTKSTSDSGPGFAFLQPHPFMAPPSASETATLGDSTSNQGDFLSTTSLVSEGGSTPPVQMKQPLQRQGGENEENLLQEQSESADPLQAEPQLPPNEGGFSLPSPIRQKFEAAFQADLGDVRVHESPEAGSIGAIAYTQGTHIHFAPGRYNPDSQGGQELLGHELTHVIQQRAGRVATPGGDGVPINADPALEAEADALGAKACSGQPVNVSGSHSGIQLKAEPPLIQCKEEEGSMLSSAWNFITNNAVSGTVGFVEETAKAAENLPRAGMAQTAGKFLAPLGLISGVMGMSDAISPEKDDDRGLLERGGDFFSNGLGAFSSAVTTLGLAGSGATAAGGSSLLAGTGAGTALTSAGAGMSGFAASAGPAAAVAGAGAGGYAAGRLLDQGTDWVMDATGASDAIDGLRGIRRGEGETGDYSISGMLGDGAVAIDQAINGDDYRESFGYRLAGWMDDPERLWN